MMEKASDSDDQAKNEKIAEFEEFFQQQWHENQDPNIDSFLGYVERDDRDVLLEKLVVIDIDQRVKAGQPVSANRYQKYGDHIAGLAGRLLGNFETALKSTHKSTQDPFDRKTIGRYRLLQKIGEGGNGTVYMADQLEPIRRRVAVKIIRVKSDIDTNKIVARFEAERQALAVMNHENICQILDAGAEDGMPYFVMELVNGIPITKYCDQMKLSIRDRLGLFLKVCSAVQHAHQKGIIHRDLKPSNILVAPHDGNPVPKVIDFGLAKTLESNNWLTDKTMFTEFGMVLGTAMYMSPEQAELNQLDVDTRSDIFSLGVVLYELLTGTTPRQELEVPREMTIEMLKKIQDCEPLRPSLRLSTAAKANETLPADRGVTHSYKLKQVVRGELDWIVMKALERDRFKRYETVDAFQQDVTRFLEGEPVLAGPPSKVYQLRKFAKKHWKSISVLTLTLIITVSLILFSLIWIQNEKFNRLQSELRSAGAEYRNAIVYWNNNRIRRFYESLNRVPEKYRFIEWRLARNAAGGMAVKEHKSAATCIAIPVDGGMFATGGSDQAILIWDLKSRKVTRKIASPHGTQGVLALAFHPQRKLLVSGGEDHWVRFWDTRTGKPHPDFEPVQLEGKVYSVDLSQDGTKLVAGGGHDINDRNKNDQFILVWNIDEPENQVRLDGHQRRVTKVSFTQDANRVVSASCDLYVYLWDLETGQKIREWKVSSLAWDFDLSPDENEIVVSTEDNYLHLLDMQRPGEKVWRREGHLKGTAVYAVAMSNDGQRFASGSFDGTVKLWHKNGDLIRTMKGHQEYVLDLAFTPDDSELVSVGMDGTSRFWQLNQGPEKMVFEGHQEPVNAIDYSPDGRLLISGSGYNPNQPFGKAESSDNSIRIWSLSKGKSIQKLDFEVGPITDVEFDSHSTEGNIFAASSAEGFLIVYDRAHGSEIMNHLAHPGGVNSLAFASKGKRLASVGNDGAIRIWNADDGTQEFEKVIEEKGSIECLAWSHDGQKIVVASRTGQITFLEANTGSILWSRKIPSGQRVNSLAFSPDGQRIFAGQSEVHVLDLRGNVLGSYANHFFETYAIDVFQDGPAIRILTGSHNGSWKLWDAENMDELNTVVPFSNRKWNHVFDVKFSPDGQTIAIANSDHRIQIWDCSER